MRSQIHVIAHRGASHARPENTLPAFSHAIELGVDFLEFDVRLSSDGQAVIMHDTLVDRTTDGTGAISTMPFSQIRKLDAGTKFNEHYAKTKIPSLEEVLDLARAADVGCDVQIYTSGSDRERLTEQVVNALAERKFDDRTFIAAEEEVVLYARQLDPNRPVCNLSGQRDNHSLELAKAVGSKIVQAFARFVTPQFVAKAHEMGITVNVFYADHVSEMERLVSCGVDGILTNEPEILLRVLGRTAAPAA